jgi:hypothetical protein
MLDQRPILREWLRASGVFACIVLAGAASVDLLLTSGLQWGADIPSQPSAHIEGTW